MANIQFRSTNAAQLKTIAAELQQDLQQRQLANDLQIDELQQSQPDVTRGDAVTWATIALTAVGAGGALTVLLGKEGFLTALAKVLEKHVEGQQAEVIIETKKGKKITVRSPVGEIKAILREIRDDKD